MTQETVDSPSAIETLPPTQGAFIISLLVGAICTSLLLYLRAIRKHTPPLPTERTLDLTLSAQRGVCLQQVKIDDRNDANTDIDIIAIHGLDTTSRDTWTWKDPRNPGNQDKWVNWLHPGMLPEHVERARIFTCDWPAELHEPSSFVQKAVDEYALLLLDGIQRELLGQGTRDKDRPIIFIASCLGGIILMRALMRADEGRSSYQEIRRLTRGAIFLATPFRGTSFQDIAKWTEPALKARASVQGQRVGGLIDTVKGSTFDLEDVVRKFTQLCQDRDHPLEISSFYEIQKTSLPMRVFPWLPTYFRQEKQVGAKGSQSSCSVL